MHNLYIGRNTDFTGRNNSVHLYFGWLHFSVSWRNLSKSRRFFLGGCEKKPSRISVSVPRLMRSASEIQKLALSISISIVHAILSALCSSNVSLLDNAKRKFEFTKQSQVCRFYYYRRSMQLCNNVSVKFNYMKTGLPFLCAINCKSYQAY